MPASIDELVRTSSLLTSDKDEESLIATLVDQAQDVSQSDIGALYVYQETQPNPLKLVYKRGKYDIPRKLEAGSELVRFLEDCGESLVINDREQQFFSEIFLVDNMNSGMALPLYTPKANIGILILNSRRDDFFGKSRLDFLDSFTKLAGGMLHNAELFKELKARLRHIEALERYQENIFSSMTNLLITTDSQGSIHYFNRIAAERLGLTEESKNSTIDDLFKKKMNRKIINQIRLSGEDGKERLGIEGIYSRGEDEMDFALNISPLRGKRGGHEGITLLFTDQSKERELRERMESVVEERRQIKDMFSRYLSQEVMQNLMESPDLVRLGGDKKIATIFFADIRGYTSFSEGKEPEYIIEVLNEYFSQAVDVVIKHNGYIDKFIGDCIMAAWGVPMYTAEKDAVAAVSCAVEIQELVKAKDRSFFKGKASKLRVGIGMHTGPLVAGNLGGAARMDYSVIGDTVNIVARLEGVAEAGDVIITQNTRDMIGDNFVLKELKPVKVKGKVKPIHIFNVLRLAR